jgi:hypothetical protein
MFCFVKHTATHGRESSCTGWWLHWLVAGVMLLVVLSAADVTVVDESIEHCAIVIQHPPPPSQPGQALPTPRPLPLQTTLYELQHVPTLVKEEPEHC